MMLPQGWVETQLEAICHSINYGCTSTSDAKRGDIRYIRITDIQDNDVEWNNVPYLVTLPKDIEKYELNKGDLVFARTGATVGKSHLFDTLPYRSVFASYLIRVRCNEKFLCPTYAKWFFQSPQYWKQINDGAEGTGQPNFNGTKLAHLVVPLPPLAEQRRIVAKLDSLTARIARARAELERARKNAEHIRIATLGRAFHWNEADLPRGWTRKKIGEIGDVQLGRQRSPKDHVGPHMRPYVRSANITWDGWDLSDVKEMNFSPAEFETFKLQPGDVLLNEGSGSPSEVGKPAIWNGEIENVCFQNTVLRVRSDAFFPELLRYVLLFLARTGAFIKNTQGVNIIHIGKAGLSRTYIPVPPITKQPEILKEIQTSFDAANRLQREADRCLTLLTHLIHGIEYFGWIFLLLWFGR
ncbi:restriction endonuclease subunit S, partial [Gluconacetobacter sacchari]